MLVCAGASLGGAIVVVMLLVTLLIMITRIIAETGLIHGQLQASLTTPWTLLVWAGVARPVSLQTYYLTAQLHSIFYDCREVVPVYASHGMKLLDSTEPGRDRKTGRRYMAALALALLVGYLVSFASMLWTEYTHDSTLDAIAVAPINAWGARDNSRYQIMDSTVYYSHGPIRTDASSSDPPGDGVCDDDWPGSIALAVCMVAVASARVFDVADVSGGSLVVQHHDRWMVRGLILRFGGAFLYAAARPFFIGLIVANRWRRVDGCSWGSP